LKEYQVIIDLEVVGVSKKKVKQLTDFVKKALKDSDFEDIICEVYWDEI